MIVILPFFLLFLSSEVPPRPKRTKAHLCFLNQSITWVTRRRRNFAPPQTGALHIESPIMMQLMSQARCDDFEVLTALFPTQRARRGRQAEPTSRALGLSK